MQLTNETPGPFSAMCMNVQLTNEICFLQSFCIVDLGCQFQTLQASQSKIVFYYLHMQYILQALLHLPTIVFLCYAHAHGLINYIDTKAKCRYLKKLTCKGTLRQVFVTVSRQLSLAVDRWIIGTMHLLKSGQFFPQPPILFARPAENLEKSSQLWSTETKPKHLR